MADSEDPPRTTLRRVLVFLGLVGLGVAVLLWQQNSREQARRRPANEAGRSVRVLALTPMDVVPRAVGYGEVAAQRDWQAVAEVSGVVEFVGEGVEVGQVVQEGAVLFRVDPQSYAIEQDKSEASVKGVRAQLSQLKAQESSARANLTLEKRVLDLAERELQSMQALYDAGNAPLIEVQTAEKAVLTAKKSVQSYTNALAEIPSSRQVLQAQLQQQEAGVETTKLEAAKTEIVAPFTMRLRQVDVVLDQAVSAGTVLVVGDGIDVVEIPARIPVGALGPLLPRRPTFTGPPAPPPEPVDGGTEDTDPAAPMQRSFSERLRSIEAIVKLDTQGVSAIWDGNLRRIEGVDPETRNLVAVVQVEETRKRGAPPLAVGLYVEVELRGSKRPNCLAVPQQAYHSGKVYVVGEGERLEIREVEEELTQEEFVCVSGGVTSGDRIVLTDLSPAVEGMLLDPRVDDEALAALREAAVP